MVDSFQTPVQSVNTNCVSCGGSRDKGDRCAYCGALYPAAIASQAPKKKLISLGSKYRVKRFGSALEISWRWWNATHLFMIPFSIFWNSIAWQFGDLQDLITDPISMFPIPLIHMVIGIIIPAYVVISFVNKTTIRANRQTLSIKHFPLPVRRAHTFDAHSIEQIFVSKGQRSSDKRTWNIPILQLVTTDGGRHELMKGSSEVEFSDYETLRLKMLDALGIAPSAVHGEVDL